MKMHPKFEFVENFGLLLLSVQLNYLRPVLRTFYVSFCSPRDVGGVEERAFSPFNLDSETGTSTAPSPVINDIASE